MAGTPRTPRTPPKNTPPNNTGAGNARELAMTRGQMSRATGVAAGLAAGGAIAAGLIGNNKIPDPFNGTGIQFPQDLDTLNHYITFRAVETKGLMTGLMQAGGFGTKINGGSIRLPLPANLSTDYNPEYTVGELGKGAAGEALSAGDRAIYGNGDVPGAAAAGAAVAAAGLGALGAIAGNAAKLVPGPVGDIIGGAAGIGGAGSGDIGAASLKVAAGLAQNPHKVVLFTGVNFREHQFSWKLSPRNRAESNAIKQIIDMFTYYSHPEYVAGALFFKYPEFFEISFNHPEYLFRLLPSVCKDVRVNYHGQGYAAYIRDYDGAGPPAPAEIELSLTFQETEIITKSTIHSQMNAPLPGYRRNPGIVLTTQPTDTRR
jgi:hypothetical protein